MRSILNVQAWKFCQNSPLKLSLILLYLGHIFGKPFKCINIQIIVTAWFLLKQLCTIKTAYSYQNFTGSQILFLEYYRQHRMNFVLDKQFIFIVKILKTSYLFESSSSSSSSKYEFYLITMLVREKEWEILVFWKLAQR